MGDAVGGGGIDGAIARYAGGHDDAGGGTLIPAGGGGAFDPASLLLGAISPTIADELCRHLERGLPRLSAAGLVGMVGENMQLAKVRGASGSGGARF